MACTTRRRAPLTPRWLAFAEVPSVRAFLGGALVVGAVVADITAARRAQVAQPVER